MSGPADEKDPLGYLLAGNGEGVETDAPRGEGGAMAIDLDQFVTTAGPAASVAGPDAPTADPVVDYPEDRGGRSYTLLHPPMVDGERLHVVSIRLPEQGDIDDFFSGEIRGNRGMICRLCGLHPAVFRRLKWQDAEALHQIYRDIVPGFLSGEE